MITRVRIPINSRPVDLDQDGDIDVLGGSRGERRIFFLENTGGETIEFNEHPIEISGTTVPDEMRTRRPRDGEPLITGFNFEFGDLNQDGRLDVVLQESSNLIWLEQPTDLSQTWTARVIGSFYPDTMTGFRFADINQDGRDDLMAGSYSQSPRGPRWSRCHPRRTSRAACLVRAAHEPHDRVDSSRYLATQARNV